jgi:hypothetical protein
MPWSTTIDGGRDVVMFCNLQLYFASSGVMLRGMLSARVKREYILHQ